MNNYPISRHHLRVIFYTLKTLRELTIKACGCLDQYPTIYRDVNISHSNLLRASFRDLCGCPEINLEYANASYLKSIEYYNTENVNIFFSYTFFFQLL